MWQAEFKLYIYPNDPLLSIEREKLKFVLSSMQFTGNKIGKNLGKSRYQTGENFLSLLYFLGCSPHIELEPHENKPYCYIEIETGREQFVVGKNTRKIKCPKCKHTLKNIRDFVTDKTLEEHLCPECNQPFNLKKINWRKTAFIASSWIVVGNIYESEAVPDEKLFSVLKNLTGVDWKIAYIREFN